MNTTVHIDGPFEEGSIIELPAGAERVRIKSIDVRGLPSLLEVWDGERYVERVPRVEVLGIIEGPVALKFGPEGVSFQ